MFTTQKTHKKCSWAVAMMAMSSATLQPAKMHMLAALMCRA
jgi:hypothetical protein